MMTLLGEGKYAEEQYDKIGEKIYEVDPDLLIVVGKEAENIGKKAIEAVLK